MCDSNYCSQLWERLSIELYRSILYNLKWPISAVLLEVSKQFWCGSFEWQIIIYSLVSLRLPSFLLAPSKSCVSRMDHQHFSASPFYKIFIFVLGESINYFYLVLFIVIQYILILRLKLRKYRLLSHWPWHK